MSAGRVRQAVATLSIAAVVVAAAPLAAVAQLVDLTGTWTGTITCKAFDTGVKTKVALAPVLRISQSGNVVGARLDVGGSQDQYDGLANPDGKKPATKGELALIRCTTDSVVGGAFGTDEIGRFAVTTKAPPAVKASLKGTSIYSAPGVVAPEVGTCAWKWTRTDRTDPNVPVGCPG